MDLVEKSTRKAFQQGAYGKRLGEGVTGRDWERGLREETRRGCYGKRLGAGVG